MYIFFSSFPLFGLKNKVWMCGFSQIIQKYGGILSHYYNQKIPQKKAKKKKNGFILLLHAIFLNFQKKYQKTPKTTNQKDAINCLGRCVFFSSFFPPAR